MSVYKGTRVFPGGVTKDGMELDPIPAQKILYCSDDFDWGYNGNGPFLLALALLLEELGEDMAKRHCFAFLDQVVSIMPHTWQLTSEQIQTWVKAQ